MRYLLLFVLGILAGSGCAVLHEEHRCVTRYLDRELAPPSTTWKAALAPLAIPVGFTALVIDGAAINPVLSLPEAVDDASEVAFKSVELQGIYEVWLFPMRLMAFTVVFVGSEVLHCTLPF